MEENKTNQPNPEVKPNPAPPVKTAESEPQANPNPVVKENQAAPVSFNVPDLTEQDSEKKFDPMKNIERLMDVEMNVTVRFGKTEIPLREAISFGIGSMIELNRSVDEPVDILVNSHLFARGEVVVLDGYYGVRVTEIGTPEERSHALLKNANN